jgi:hypothetical protein
VSATSSTPRHSEFHVSKPDGWPAGEYEVKLLLDSRSVEHEDFRVE